jgi:TatD DNase family protein
LRWTDNHCHLDPTSATETIADARAAGVERLITVGTDLAESQRAIDLSRSHDGLWATAGEHPHDAKEGIDGLADLLVDDAGSPTPVVVAVGECGLDYHYDHSPRPVQRDTFAAQIALAHERDLPLVIHSREAWDDTFDVLAAEGVPTRTVFHCFTGGPDEALRCLGLGAYLSFSGIVTFKNAADVQAAARVCPLDRMLVETDSPYLAPVPHRGAPNRPEWVPLVGSFIADLRDAPVGSIAEATSRNALAFFGVRA